jgi:alpha-beta hydrolase superfamily lysophospholipase
LTLVWIILWVVFFAAAIRAWTWIATRWLSLERHADQVHFATTPDGWTLALHRYLAAERRYCEPVVLCHGLGANRFNFDLADDRSLARTLAQAGFDVWSLELRGHGASSRPGWFSPHSFHYDFDDLLDRDLPAALALVRRVSGQSRLFWVGHSLGGMLGYALAGEPATDALAGLVTIASPVWLDRSPGVGRLAWMAKLLGPMRSVLFRPLARFAAPLLGSPPGFLARPFLHPGSMEPRLVRRAMVNLVESDSVALVRQMASWIEQRGFRSRDGERDYLARLDQVELPALLIAAERDGLASPEAVAPAYERLRSRDKQLRVFGSDAGDDFDFGHGDLLLGRLAPKVIHVEVLDWLEQHASPAEQKGEDEAVEA